MPLFARRPSAPVRLVSFFAVMILILAGLISPGAPGVHPALAATITALNLNDSGSGSLRDAITTANGAPSATTIVFASGLTGTILLTSGELAITNTSYPITIDGGSPSLITVDGNNMSRAFNVTSGANGTLKNLTIQNGKAPASYAAGGGVENAGTLTISGSILTNNHAQSGGAVDSTLGTVTIDSSTLSNNIVDYYGGGVENNDGTLTITNSTIAGNTAGLSGGGVESYGTLNISNSTVSGNKSNYGGGLINLINSTATITGSTFTGNTANSYGGGVDNDTGGTMSISNTTVSGNTATVGGGGVSNGNLLTLSNSTISGNTVISGNGGGVMNSASLNLLSTVIAGNFGTHPDLDGPANTYGYNLIGDGTGASGISNGSSNDQVGTAATPINPSLGTLQNNGGSTFTQAITNSSPAYQAGNCGGNLAPVILAVTTDQRGITRKAKCDIGAYEIAGTASTPPATSPATLPATLISTPPAASATPQLTIADPSLAKVADLSLAQPGEVVHFTLTVTNSGTGTAPNVIVTDGLPSLLTIRAATTTQGTFVINQAANTVIFSVGAVNPGEMITLTVSAIVSGSAKPPADVINTATLSDGEGHTSTASAPIHITAGILPATGEHPADDNGSSGLWVGLVLLGTAMALFVSFRTRRAKSIN